jgi:hypothetical protein
VDAHRRRGGGRIAGDQDVLNGSVLLERGIGHAAVEIEPVVVRVCIQPGQDARKQ